MNKISHKTRNGITIDFQVCQMHDPWNDVGGIYAFGYFPGGGQPFQVLYFGKTTSFRARFADHERWAEAKRMGATVVLAAVYHLEGDRDKIEQILIAELNPPLNTHYRSY